MKNIFMPFVLMLLQCALIAQNKITGTITDQDNLPLANAVIFLPEINKGTVSDKNGYYELSDLPNGKFKVQYSFIGYTTKIETFILTGTIVQSNITLRSTAIETEEIVITGGYNSTQHENAVNIETLKIDPLTIKSTPNFAEILTKIPGIDMISKGSGVSKPVIRGLSMNDILILDNGVRFENYQYSDHHSLGIDESGTENVEVIKGPASLLYGSDAIGGVINFIKEKPAPVNTINADYNLQLFSNTLGMTNNFGIKGTSKKFFGGIRVCQKTDADFLQGGGKYAPNSRFNEYSVKANSGYSGQAGTFKLFYEFDDQQLGLPEADAIKEITKRGRENKIWFEHFKIHLISSQNKIYLGKFKLDLNAAYQNTELIHIAEVNVYPSQMKLATLSYETKLYFPSNENSEYIIGFQGINQTNTNIKNRDTKLLPDARMNNYSAFGLIQHTFFKKLELQAGLRYDNKSLRTLAVGSPDSSDYRNSLNKNYSSVSGSFGAIYYISRRLLFRVNIAAAYRTPNLAELTANGVHETAYEVGDKNLVPENSYEFDLSMHYQSNNLTFDIAGFYNMINHYIFSHRTGDTTSSGIYIYKYMQSNSSLIGGEAGIHYHPKPIEWLHLEATYSTVIGKQTNGEYLPFIPAGKLNIEVRAEKEKFSFLHKAFVSINSGTAFNQNIPAPDETKTKGYTLIDLSIGGNIKMMNQFISIIIAANNFFDTKYFDHMSTLQEVNLYNPGRNISLSLKVPFEIKKVE